jgi:GTP-binding protein
MFVDEIKVYARAGHGGRGCVAFLRESFRPKGGPSGGNGGKGGDVILEADHDLNNLIQQYYQPRLIAEEGHPGMGKGMDGPAGSDCLIKVPCGTLVWRQEMPPGPELVEGKESDAPSNLTTSVTQRPVMRHTANATAMEYDLSRAESRQDKSAHSGSSTERELVCDLTTHGQRLILCRGGRGGLGNRNFATARRQAPRFAQPGEPGGEGHFVLELRTIADVGLVGFPNAGKSTLLAAISKARPRIAPYPFTTLTPHVGIVEFPDWKRITVCDVPGLIEGAHRNVGLGHAFLRHVARCKVIVVVVDMAGSDNRDPREDYACLIRELELFNPDLLLHPRIIAANKMDEPTAAENLKSFRKRIKKVKILPLAAAFDEGVAEFKIAIRKMAEAARTTAL